MKPLEQAFAAVGVQAPHVGDRRVVAAADQCGGARPSCGDDRSAVPREDRRARRRGAAGVRTARSRLPVDRHRTDPSHRTRVSTGGRDDHQPVVGVPRTRPIVRPARRQARCPGPPAGRRDRDTRTITTQPSRTAAIRSPPGDHEGCVPTASLCSLPGRPAQMTPPRTTASRPVGRPHGVGHAAHPWGALAHRVDPVHGHTTALDERDQSATRFESSERARRRN